MLPAYCCIQKHAVLIKQQLHACPLYLCFTPISKLTPIGVEELGSGLGLETATIIHPKQMQGYHVQASAAYAHVPFDTLVYILPICLMYYCSLQIKMGFKKKKKFCFVTLTHLKKKC
jgi:hypothetical protein